MTKNNTNAIVKVPQLRFAGFEKEWREKKLGQLVKIQRGRFSPRPRNNPIYYGGDIPFVQTSDVVHSNGRINSYSQSLNEKGLAVSKKFDKGSILITIAANIGYAGVLEIDMACPDSLIGLICQEDIHNYFLNYQLAIEQPKMDYLAVAAAQKNINIDFLKPYLFTIPSLPEQQKIVSFLMAVDQKLAQLAQKKNLLGQYKKGAMQQLFSQELRFKQPDGSDFPDWEERRLGEVGKIVTGSTPPTSNTDYYDGNGLFVSPADIGDHRFIVETKTTLTKLGMDKGRKISKGAVLFVCIGSTIGKVAQAGNNCFTNQQINSIIAKSSFSNEFLYSLLVFNGSRIKLLAGVQAVPQINKTDFSNLKFHFPSIPEQQKIAAFLSSLDKKIETVAQQIGKAQTFKKGLLQKMFV